MKKKNSNKNTKLLIIMVVTIALFVISLVKPFTIPGDYVENIESITIGHIPNNTKVTQKFVSELEYLDTVTLQFANFGKENMKGKLLVSIYNDNNDKIYYNEFKLKEMKDNSPLKLEFNVQKHVKDKEYTIVTETYGMEDDDEITFWAVSDPALNAKSKIKHYIPATTDSNIELEGKMAIMQSGEAKGYYYSVIFFGIFLVELFVLAYKKFKGREYYETKKIYKFIYLSTLLVMSIFMSYSIIDLCNDFVFEDRLALLTLPIAMITTIALVINLAYNCACKNIKLEKLFLALAIPFGALYLCAIVPGNVPDEFYHYRIAYQATRGNFLLNDNKAPKNGNIMYRRYNDAKEALIDKAESKKLKKFAIGGYSPLLYVFASIGIGLGRLLGLTILGTKYLGCLCNFIAFLIIGYNIIKILPYGKGLALVYMMSPINMQQMTSLSADAVINMTGLLFIAEVIKLYCSKESLNTKSAILLGVLSLFLLFCKYAYFPMLLLLLLLKDNFKKSDGRVKKVFAILIVLAFAAIGAFYIHDNNLKEIKAKTQQKETVKSDIVLDVPQKKYTRQEYIKENPSRFVYIFLNMFKMCSDIWIKQFTGVILGTLVITTKEWIGYLYLFLLLLLSIDEMKFNKTRKISKILMISVIVLEIILISLGLYLGWSPMRGKYISGVQGRYFIPFFLLIPYLFTTKKLKLDIPNKQLVISVILTIVHVFSIVYVLEYYLY